MRCRRWTYAFAEVGLSSEDLDGFQGVVHVDYVAPVRHGMPQNLDDLVLAKFHTTPQRYESLQANSAHEALTILSMPASTEATMATR